MLHNLVWLHFSVCLFSATGRIDASEIQQSLAELGINLSKEDARKILHRFGLFIYAYAASMDYNP